MEAKLRKELWKRDLLQHCPTAEEFKLVLLNGMKEESQQTKSMPKAAALSSAETIHHLYKKILPIKVKSSTMH